MDSGGAIRSLVVLGTRPEAIKLAPVIRAMQRDPNFDVRVVTTGQHREMLDQVLTLFDIVPDVDLDVFEPGQGICEIAAKSLSRLATVIRDVRPTVAVVQGDTTTTFVGAFAAFNERVPVVHLEAGLRTGSLDEPFPEEANRRLTTQIATLHLAPTSVAENNLLREGVPAGDISVTGNTGIDALQWAASLERPWQDDRLQVLDIDPRRVLLVTAHRRETWGAGILDITRALRSLATSRPDIRIVFPAHANPLVREPVTERLGGLENVTILDPVMYSDMARLMGRASIVLTDSGGLQEEAPSLAKPVLVLRDSTERPEGVTAGVARLVGTDPRRIIDEVNCLLDHADSYRRMSAASNPYGDGRAAERSLDAIVRRWLPRGAITNPTLAA